MMQAYAEYKDSGVDWLGKIPARWEVKRLKFLCSIGTGERNTEDKIDSGKYPFYVRSQKAEKINSYSFDGEAILTAGDGAGVGKVYHYVDGKFDFHQRVYKFSNFNCIFGKYLFHYISNTFYSVAILGTAKSTVDSLRLPLIQDFWISFPATISEQTAIADFLDDKTAKIEALTGIKRRQIALLGERKQILIQNAVTKGMNPSARMKDSGVDWIGEIPAHWKVKRLASFGAFSKGGGFSKSDLADAGTDAVLYGDIYTQYDFVIDRAVRTILPKVADKSVWITQGDLLFTGSGETKEDIGKCVLYRGSTKVVAGGDVILFRQTKNHPLFLSFCLNTNGAVEQKAKASKGEIIVHTYASKLKNIFIPIPPVDEQKEIAKFVWDGVEAIDEVITIKQNQIKKLNEYKVTLINAAVTGKIKVT